VLDITYTYTHYNGRIFQKPEGVQLLDEIGFAAELPAIRARFPRMTDYYPENFYQHHGLRFMADQATLEYIRERDIMDVGAFIGDSLVVLRNYTNRRVISYELVPQTYKMALQWASDKCLVFNKGVSGTPGTIHISSKGSHGSSLRSVGRVPIEVTTIDAEVERLHLNVGMIKADIEGSEIAMLNGARKTIQEQRPVLAIAMYHGLEMIDLPKVVEEFGIYELHYFFSSPRWAPFFELNLFAVPLSLTGYREYDGA
jgi:FkbM family methyltransferase